MGTQTTKLPKSKPKVFSKRSKNGESNVVLDKHSEEKLGFNKKNKNFSETREKIGKRSKDGENSVVLERYGKGKMGSRKKGKSFSETREKMGKESSRSSKEKPRLYGERSNDGERRNMESSFGAPHNFQARGSGSDFRNLKDKDGGSNVVLERYGKGKMGKENIRSFNGKIKEFGKRGKDGERRSMESFVGDSQKFRGRVSGLDPHNPQSHPSKGRSKKDGENNVDLDKGYKKENEEIANMSKVPFLRTSKKMNGEKRKKVEGRLDGEIEAKPKKKKRVIRIDPYDTSNKRLDDGIGLNEVNKKKKEDKEGDTEKVELSKNAQFRAIQPSPSILSFVEDNLLGRRRDIELRRAGYNIELSAPLDNIPFSTSSERERIEESVFRNKMEFFAAAKVSSSFPPPDLPEIAFAGRSNVGKSSLLNALTRQWGIVRTSDKPGLTQTINFFKLGNKLCPVDLPGYGFAYAKEEVKENWEDLVKEYVSTRIGLKRVCLLIDTKWGMKPRDHELIHLMERSQTKYQIVLTKTDTVFPLDVARRAMQIEETLKKHKSVVQPVMMVSSKSGAGILSMRTVLAKVARFLKP